MRMRIIRQGHVCEYDDFTHACACGRHKLPPKKPAKPKEPES